jgi:uncharacterized protein
MLAPANGEQQLFSHPERRRNLMKAGFRIIDSDLHVEEPSNFLDDYLAEPYRSMTKIANSAPPGEVSLVSYELNGRRYRTGRAGAIQKLKVRKPPLHAFRELTAQDHLDGMDVEGIDIGVVFPTQGNGLMAAFEDLAPDYAGAIAHAYNSWMRDFCNTSPTRLIPTAIVNYADPVGAAAEARRAVQELGAVAIVGTCNIINGHQPHDPHYDPLWKELEQLGVPVCFHPTGHRPQEGMPTRFRNPDSDTIAHALTNPFLNMMNLASFTTGGVFERFPKLRAGFLETSASWITWLLWRLDEHWELFGPDERWTLSMKPSQYFHRQGWVALEPEETPTKYVVDDMGDNNIVISTDFPHVDCLYPNAMDEFVELEGLSAQTKQKILWDNCARLYNLDQETGQNRWQRKQVATTPA